MAKYIEKKSYLSLLLTFNPISENLKKIEKMILFTKKIEKNVSKKFVGEFSNKVSNYCSLKSRLCIEG